jgi:hypothetical protein
MDDNNPKNTSRNSQHPIPQNFMDVEFKIIGDLTMRQFVYLVAFGGPTYLFYVAPMPAIIKWPLVVFFGLLTFVLIAVPIDDRGADEWIVNLFKAIYGVNQRIYKKTPEIPRAFSMKSVEFIQAGMIATTSTSNRRKVEEYIKGISKFEEKPDEFDYNFSSRRYTEVRPTLAETLVQRETQKPSPFTSEEVLAQPAFEEVVLFTPTTKTEIETKPKFEFKKQIVVPEISKIIPQKIKALTKKVSISDSQDQLRTSVSTAPGRKFISFSKKEAEELILPIRGEKSINIFDRTPLIEPNTPKKDIKTITKELEQITKEVKKTYGVETFRSINLDSIETTNNNLSGVVLNEEGSSLKGIDVQIYDDKNSLISNSISDENGKFNFFNLKTGKYQLKISNPYLHSLNFDIINLDILGFPYPQIKIVGKKYNG